MSRFFTLIIAVLAAAIHLNAQTTLTGSFQHGGLQRTYRVYIPPTYASSVPAPLIINLHGYGSNNLEQEFYSNFKPIADTAGFVLVHPNGTPDFTNTLHWNTFGTSTVDDVGFLSALIDTLSVQLNIDQSRVYATGMSNGGFMSFQLACQLTQRIAAIASVTGTMTNTNLGLCQPSRPIAIMQIHGTADATVPYNGNVFFAPVQNLLNFWISYNGTSSTPQIYQVPDINPNDGCTAERYTYAGGTNGTQVIHYKVIGGGHSWPGAPVNINVTNMDFSASAEIWRFFRQYSTSGLIAGTGNVSQNAGHNIQVRQQGKTAEFILPGEKIRGIRIFDLNGRIVHETITGNQRFVFSPERSGVYFLITGDGLKKKFIIP